jgi:hypothetical protein
MRLTGDADTVDVVWDDALGLDDLVELGACPMENNRIEADARQEAKAKRELVDLLEHGASDLDNREPSRVRRMRRRAKDAQVSLYLTFGPNRVEQTGDGVLSGT